ncbi:unnamed protein product, partial [Closterium sp. NIES-54]
MGCAVVETAPRAAVGVLSCGPPEIASGAVVGVGGGGADSGGVWPVVWAIDGAARGAAVPSVVCTPGGGESVRVLPTIVGSEFGLRISATPSSESGVGSPAMKASTSISTSGGDGAAGRALLHFPCARFREPSKVFPHFPCVRSHINHTHTPDRMAPPKKTLRADAPWRAKGTGVALIGGPPLATVRRGPEFDYAMSIMRHPDPIGMGLAQEAGVEAAGEDCLVPGLKRPVIVMGVQVWPLEINSPLSWKAIEPMARELKTVSK